MPLQIGGVPEIVGAVVTRNPCGNTAQPRWADVEVFVIGNSGQFVFLALSHPAWSTLRRGTYAAQSCYCHDCVAMRERVDGCFN